MKATTFLLILTVGLATGQLNFDGNPLTENTEYTAEESRFSERTARLEKTATNVTISILQHPENVDSKKILLDHPKIDEKASNLVTVRPEQVKQTARYLSVNAPNQPTDSASQAQLALSSFLNSKTPEESQMSLNSFLQSREGSQNVAAVQRTVPFANQQQLVQQQVPVAPRVNQQVTVSSPVNQHLTSQLMQQRQALQAFSVNQRQQQSQLNDRVYNGPVNQELQTVSNPVAVPVVQQQQPLQQTPYMTALQARNDMYYPGWYNRVRRLRGKPIPFAQSRGGPGFYNGPVPGPLPFKPKVPVEVIYTKPPGFHRGPPHINNPPVPYEDAGAWFPEADHPPPSKDVYYSQLYAQSYDPHYYNYIAKTGKIKPHLYGKLGKYEHEGSGIWSELYQGFKKHGLKNIMTPTFLLGMTLPVVTLMLTALVQKRSLSRSDSRDFPEEETIQEYLEQLQRAVECYERKRRKGDENVDEC